METAPENLKAVGQQSIGVSVAAPVFFSPAVKQLKSSEEQRAKWREEFHRKKARRAAAALGTVGPLGAPLSDPAPESGPAVQTPAAPPAVPWSADLLRTTTERVIDACEKSSIDELREAASEIPDKALAAKIVAKVERDAPWNTVSKATLKENLPVVIADGLNALGISAERAPQVLSLVAAVEIWNGHQSLKEEIRKIAAEHTAVEVKKAA